MGRVVLNITNNTLILLLDQSPLLSEITCDASDGNVIYYRVLQVVVVLTLTCDDDQDANATIVDLTNTTINDTSIVVRQKILYCY